jgi:hypothetical protein
VLAGQLIKEIIMPSSDNQIDANCMPDPPKHVQFLHVIGRIDGVKRRLYRLRDEIKGDNAKPEVEAKAPPANDSLGSVLENAPNTMNTSLEMCEKLVSEIRELLF